MPSMPIVRARWVHNLDKILDGNLDEIIDALATHEQAEKLRQLNTQSDK